MKKDLLQQHFQKSGFDGMQSDALAAVFEEMATKHDLALLRAELKGDMNALRADLKGDMNALRSELKGEMRGLRADLKGEMSSLKAHVAVRRPNRLPWHRDDARRCVRGLRFSASNKLQGKSKAAHDLSCGDELPDVPCCVLTDVEQEPDGRAGELGAADESFVEKMLAIK